MEALALLGNARDEKRWLNEHDAPAFHMLPFIAPSCTLFHKVPVLSVVISKNLFLPYANHTLPRLKTSRCDVHSMRNNSVQTLYACLLTQFIPTEHAARYPHAHHWCTYPIYFLVDVEMERYDASLATRHTPHSATFHRCISCITPSQKWKATQRRMPVRSLDVGVRTSLFLYIIMWVRVVHPARNNGSVSPSCLHQVDFLK